MIMEIQTIEPNSLTQRQLYRYLVQAIAPRPICLASTIDQSGQVNLSPFSFFNVFSSNPPVMIFSPARSGRDGSTKNTLDNVLEVKEVVVNVVNHQMVEQMSLSSTAYEKGVNEFVKSGFTEVGSVKISPPRVGEAPVAFECSVNEIIPLGHHGGAGNLVIAEVLLIHVKSDFLGQDGFLDTRKLDLVGRMGDNWYCRASGDALFEVSKPIAMIGIGVDQLPQSVRNSEILSGNNLGRLGTLPNLPSLQQIQSMRTHKAVETIIANQTGEKAKQALHQLAKNWLSEQREMEALSVLCLADQL